MELTERRVEISNLLKALSEIGYSSPAVAHVFRMAKPVHSLLTSPGFCALVYYDTASKGTSAIAVLGAMLACGGWIETGIYESVVPRAVREMLESCGFLVELPGNYVRAGITLHEFRSKWFFSDPVVERKPDELLLVGAFENHVDPPNYSSLSLLLNVEKPRAEDDRFLDIGCGTGIQSIFASMSYKKVVAIDVNDRAVAFSKMNAVINDAEIYTKNCSYTQFDVTDRFDRLVLNSPSVPRYRSGLNEVGTYTSSLGHDLALKFMSERLPGLLREGGLAEVWSILSLQEGLGGVPDLLRRSVPGIEQFNVDVLLERKSPFGLSKQQIAARTIPRDSFLLASPDEADLLLKFLRVQRIERVVPAIFRINKERGADIRVKEVETFIV